MAEYDDNSFLVKKKDVLDMYDRIAKYLMKDFETKYQDHKKQSHSWFIQGTIHGICRNLFMDKQVVIYLILGENPRRPGWGTLKEKYSMEPLKFLMRKNVVSKGREIEKDHGFKVYFTDTKRNGDFHMKVVYYKYKKEEESSEKKEDSSSTEYVEVKTE